MWGSRVGGVGRVAVGAWAIARLAPAIRPTKTAMLRQRDEGIRFRFAHVLLTLDPLQAVRFQRDLQPILRGWVLRKIR